MNVQSFYRYCRLVLISLVTILLLAVFTCALYAQPKYHTFSQDDLALKKSKKTGKKTGSFACFTFHNTTDSVVNDLHAKFGGEILTVESDGGFTTVTLDGKKKMDASGRTVLPGDSVEMCFTFHKKDHDVKVKEWWWTKDTAQVGSTNKNLTAVFDSVLRKQPNGGNVRDFIYKRIIERPEGLVIGIETDTPNVGWIRFKKSDRKYFPHNRNSRCFDSLKEGEHGEMRRPFIGERKNLHVKKHNNHLLGELHALNLAIIANDSGVTEPFSGETALGDLIYRDDANASDPCNNKTLRQIVYLTDSGLTYCKHFSASFYFGQDSCISRINRAFDGPYVALTFHPLTIAGTNPRPAFLHPNPFAAPVSAFRRYDVESDVPDGFSLAQNYPNPFNPTTTIDFTLSEGSIVSLKVYNMLGQEIVTLLDRELMDEGDESVDFDASRLTSGVYFYKLVAQGVGERGERHQSVKRMVLIK